MPLKKSASLSENNKRRNDNYHSRKAGEEKFGKAAVKGKEIHHKDGNQCNNAPSNLSLKTPSSHGKEHGRGNGKRGKKK